MHIRAITLGFGLDDVSVSDVERIVSSFPANAQERFAEDGVDVRTIRLLTSPINHIERYNHRTAVAAVKWVGAMCARNGIRWFCIPFDLVSGSIQRNDIVELALQILRKHANAFICLVVARQRMISPQSALIAARLIKMASRMDNTGFYNFRMGAAANCRPNTPFFPFSYHDGRIGFSVALELPGHLLDLINRCDPSDLDGIRTNVVEELGAEIKRVNSICLDLERHSGIEFKGIDTSLAPFPKSGLGVGDIFRALSGNEFGCNGSIYYASYLASLIRDLAHSTGIRSTGFNGVMYSLLEDQSLSANNHPSTFNPDLLLASSAVCGCGWDMVPIPGKTPDEDIAALILDVAALSSTLSKPLGIRTLPIPAKYENEITEFNSEFLCNTRIRQLRPGSPRTTAFALPNAFLMPPLHQQLGEEVVSNEDEP